MNWEKVVNEVGMALTSRVMAFEHFQMRPITKKRLEPLLSSPSIHVDVPTGWSDEFVDRYEIVEGKSFYLVHVIEEFQNLGSPDADVRSDQYIFSEKKWTPEKIHLHHWEDGDHSYLYLPKRRHTAQYLLNIEPPDGYHRWQENEYQDYSGFMPSGFEFVKEM